LKTKVHYIEGLISQGENLFQDFKFAINDSKKIARSLVAFSNTLGGRLLIGVKDNGSIVGVRTDEEFYMVQAAADLYCRPNVIFETKDWNVSGKKVLEIIIPQSAQKPHLALGEDNKWLAYIRVADENILANSVILKAWQKQKDPSGLKIHYNEAGKMLLTYLSENEQISFSLFLKLASISYQRATNILSDFIALNLIETVYQDNKFVYKAINKEN
jgi:predicted HTH transcriptional regulator